MFMLQILVHIAYLEHRNVNPYLSFLIIIIEDNGKIKCKIIIRMILVGFKVWDQIGKSIVFLNNVPN